MDLERDLQGQDVTCLGPMTAYWIADSTKVIRGRFSTESLAESEVDINFNGTIRIHAAVLNNLCNNYRPFNRPGPLNKQARGL